MKLYDVKQIGEAGVIAKAVNGLNNLGKMQIKNPFKKAQPTQQTNQPLQPQSPAATQSPAAQVKGNPDAGSQAAQQFVEIMKKNGSNFKMEDIKMIRQQLEALLKQSQVTAPQPQAQSVQKSANMQPNQQPPQAPLSP
jgi:hypothetical protein